MQRGGLTMCMHPCEDSADIDLIALHETLAARAQETLHPVETILEYRHQRTVQMMSLDTSLVEPGAG